MTTHQEQYIETLVNGIANRSKELHATIAELVRERNDMRAALLDAESALEDYDSDYAMRALTAIRRGLYGEP